MWRRLASLIAATALLSGTAQAAPVSVSGLLGAVVADPQGKRLGTMRDFAIDLDAGAVSYAIVDYHDPQARDSRLRAVPLAALRPALQQDRLVLQPDSRGPSPPRDEARLMRARTLIGMEIDHPSGADYGILDDLVIELDNGRVLHAEVILDAAPQGVMREVPLGALRFPPAASRAILTLAAQPRPK